MKMKYNLTAYSCIVFVASLSLPSHETLVSAAYVARTFTIRPRRSRPPLSPDCFIDKDMLLADDLNPGPEIRANVGDTIQIKWVNESPSEGVTIHYHGLAMKDQPYADGTGGVNTCVVGPMQTFYQTFVANNAGTHYWHGHTSLDRMDGLQGPIIIEDPNDPEEQALKELYDEERVIFLQDWYHRSGPGIRNGLDSEPFIWLGNAQTFLINGKGRYQPCVDDPENPLCDPEGCSVEDYLSSVQVEEGKTYLFRIINAASLVSVNFAIANHNMTIVRADGTYVEPVEVHALDVNVAQRYSVLVTADQAAGASYWISTKVRHRGGIMGQAYLQYGDAAPPSEEDDLAEHIDQDNLDAGPLLDSLLVSKNVTRLPNSEILGADVVADRSIVFVGTQTRLADNNLLRWASNNVSNSLHSPKPLLTMAYEAVHDSRAVPWPDTEIPKTIVLPDVPPVEWNHTEKLQDEGVSIFHDQHGIAVYKFVVGDVVDMVLQNTRALNGAAEVHSWHLHGHSVYVVGQGYGTFDPQIDPMFFNLENPLLRDTISVWPLGWTAIRFRADNVGAWAFHCAMTPHAVMGMGFNVITSPDLLTAPPPGLESCSQTSVNPKDAQVCILESEENSGKIDEEVPVLVEDDVIPEDPMYDDGITSVLTLQPSVLTVQPTDMPDNSTFVELEIATTPPTELPILDLYESTNTPTELPVLDLIDVDPMEDLTEVQLEEAAGIPINGSEAEEGNMMTKEDNMTVAKDDFVFGNTTNQTIAEFLGGNTTNQSITDEGTSSAEKLSMLSIISTVVVASLWFIIL